MRAIEYRAWEPSTRTMHNDIAYITMSGGAMSLKRPLIQPIIMQYIGLKDCNGKKICEGDILVWDSAGINGNIWIVKAVDGGWDPFISDMQTDGSWHYRIVGNIYENPELLVGR